MKSLDAFVVSARLLLGGVLLFAGIGKLVFPMPFVAHLASSRVLGAISLDGRIASHSVAAATGTWEVLLGTTVLLRGRALHAIAIALTFVVYSLFLVLDGRASCPCTWGTQLLGVTLDQKILRNTFLVGVALGLLACLVSRARYRNRSLGET